MRCMLRLIVLGGLMISYGQTLPEVFKGNFMQANVNRHKMYSPELREQPPIRESFLHVCFII